MEDGMAPRDPAAMAGHLFGNAVQLPDASNKTFYRQTRRLHTILTSRDSMNNIPENLEARRRIAFFSNSLFMNMPHAPQVEKMMAFSVLTPYYNEEVVYSREQLRTENEDGVSTLYYLQTIYADEWKNFMQRMRREGMEKDGEIWTTKLRDLRLWASYRGQTLGRTVRGMMYYYRALKMLAFLDSASEMDIKEGSRELGSMRRDNGLGSFDSESSLSKSLSRNSSSVNSLFKGHEYGTALMKFTYVVACQIYGAQKAKKDPHAEEILYLMKNNEALRVAYVDEVNTGRDEKEYYSVLVKYDQQLDKEVEIYRVKLPGPLKLGEGKPENQNHALIFTRGDAVQTIDMNQDNYFEEALKMRNLLEEYRRYYGARKPTILGVREHIFTGSVSSLAWFMSAQETSFVTLGQRVLANPLKIRMHYGHPDVFDRFWFMTRGGISKASRVINISEDIFAGFNCTLRGGNITHHEYIQVGKGRDVGLNQISMFEAKVASGNGEQILSRDVYRLGHRLDFFRMLSFFYTTVGFFLNTMMVILTVYAFLWGRLYLALSGVEGSALANKSGNNKALGAILNQQFIIQLGLFTALPMIVENSLEHGFLEAIWDFLTMQLQLSSVFYTFSMGTRTHFFGRTILHGGAKYRATGRGFVVQHKSFAENYRLYARSHFVKAIELGLILVVYAAYSPVAKDTFVYIAMTISSWFLVVSWIMAPFVFNPSGFDWLKTVYDFDDFMDWIWYQGGVFAKSEQSWERWWYEEQDHLRTTGLWGKLLDIILDLRFFFFQYGIVFQLGIAAGSTSIAVYFLSWIYIAVAFGFFLMVGYARNKYAAKEHIYYRMVQFLIIVLGILVIIALLQFTSFKFTDVFTSLLAFIPTGWGILLIAQVVRPFLPSILWEAVISVARLYDIMFGVIVMVPVAFLSWMPGFQSMQTRILFNEAFSRGLRIFQLVTGKKS
uniref:Glycosyl transferase 48 domain-containing protein n=1 Tax=Salix viminalis TaxID=40686 RepID=A0A6N2MFU7_SALVM